MTTRHLIHCFEFVADRRGEFTASDPALIHVSADNDARLKLGKDQFGRYRYPTDADLWIRTPLFEPGGAKGWDLIQVDAGTPIDLNLVEVTSIRYRLRDETGSEWHWTGAAWAAAGASDWNTLAEVNANLASFWTSTRRAISFVLNLATTDGEYTPRVRHLVLAYTCAFESVDEELFTRGLVPTLKEAIRPVGEFRFDSTNSNPEVLPETEAPIDVVDVVEVYDEVADPSHDTNLRASYNPTTREIGLTAPIPAGQNRCHARFTYRPFVAIRVNQDVIEPELTPAIIVSSIESISSARRMNRNAVIDVTASPPAGIVWPGQRQATYRVDLLFTAPLLVDLQRLRQKFQAWIDATAQITLPALGERVDVKLIDPFTALGPPNLQDSRTVRCVIEIANVIQWDQPAVVAGDPGHPGEGYAVKQAIVAADLGATEETFTIE